MLRLGLLQRQQKEKKKQQQQHQLQLHHQGLLLFMICEDIREEEHCVCVCVDRLQRLQRIFGMRFVCVP